MSNPSNPARAKILDAALTLFARYGFQRTSMADIAKAAGVSRPALYLRFCGKAEIFDALARQVVADALARASAAWVAERSFEENLNATILAKDLPLYRVLHSPHGEELLAVDAARSASLAAELDAGFAAILAARLNEAVVAGALDLAALGGSGEFAATVTALAGGLKREVASEAAYVDVVARLCRMVTKACQAVV